MPSRDGLSGEGEGGPGEVAGSLVARAPQDVVFVMRFLGESQLLLQRHFKDYITEELGSRGASHDTHPLLQYFIDVHAAELRDFVFTGVSLSRQFPIREIEVLTGDTGNVMRVDLWDALRGHIEMAERKFRTEAEDLPRLLAGIEARAGRGEGER
ncbi:hypothetical protein LNKW23_23330 [Paralimibaculum aggregatum]|uniref:Uncharacterized protein n=1 Tax=Paralimibaculum aggregatum TaxID=3036245 RepID=A0ABQ6LLF3_9RHOB|nr:hypothetical protein [Limibaculum sp. NKW23]GMG83120.1 hypothetical protein LNKW23_23330 [Limibaculum sp. NKW23]